MHSIFSIIEVLPWMHTVLVGDDVIAVIEEKDKRLDVYCKAIALQHMRELALGLSYVVSHNIDDSIVMRLIHGVELEFIDGTLLACKLVDERL